MAANISIYSTEYAPVTNEFYGADVFAFNHYPLSSTAWCGDYPGSSPPPAPAKPSAVRCDACQMKQNPPDAPGAAWECVKCGNPL